MGLAIEQVVRREAGRWWNEMAWGREWGWEGSHHIGAIES